MLLAAAAARKSKSGEVFFQTNLNFLIFLSLSAAAAARKLISEEVFFSAGRPEWLINMLSRPHIIISEYNQTYHTSPSCYFVLDLLCVKINTL